MQILWTTVLTTWFPTTEPYKLAFKSPLTTNDFAPDGVVIEIRFTTTSGARAGHAVTRSNEIQEFQIFLLELKSPDKDTVSGWASAEDQLCQYFEINFNDCNKMFGAIGIGTKVIFVQWDRAAPQNCRHLHPAALDWTLPADRVKLEEQLNNVKANGWDLAISSVRR